MSDGVLETPYYLPNEDTFASLEKDLSILPPHLRTGYRNLETTVSKAFTAKYGQYLNPLQIEYLSGTQTIYTDPEAAQSFSQNWDEDIVSIEPNDADIRGRIYISYAVGESEEVPEHQTDRPGESIVTQYWGGRIALYPIREDEIYPVDVSWLMSDKAFYDVTSKMSISDAFSLTPLFVYSTSIGGAVIHEKVHGVQDYKLPLPILEAAAHYYQRELFKLKDWHYAIGNNMELLADFYGQCVEKLGEDVHRLIFGNLQVDARREALLHQLKEKFSLEKIEELSKHNEHDWLENKHKWIQWRTLTVQDVEEEIRKKRSKARVQAVGS